MMRYALVKTVCGGGVLLVNHDENINFPLILVNKSLNLSSCIIALSQFKELPNYAKCEKEQYLNLSVYNSCNFKNIINETIEMETDEQNTNCSKTINNPISSLSDVINRYSTQLDTLKKIKAETKEAKKEKKDAISNLKSKAEKLVKDIEEIVLPFELV